MDDALDPEYEGMVEILGDGEQFVVVVARGEVDSQTIPIVEAALGGVIRGPDVKCAVLDLDEVVFFGSAGIAMLTQADAEARARGVDLRLVVPPSSRVHRVLEMMGMTRLLALYPTRDEALSSRGP